MLRSFVAGAFLVTLLSGWLVGQETQTQPPQEMQLPQPTEKHEFLKKFVGEWECETEAWMDPSAEPEKSSGSMTGSMMGGFWAVVDVEGDMGGMEYHGRGTFGFDAERDQYVGNWIDNCTGFMWKYEGRVEGNRLILDSEGPNMLTGEGTVKVRDTWEFQSDDVIVLTGEMEQDGKFVTVMKCTCRRK